MPEHISRSSIILDFFHPSATDVQKPVESAPEEKKPVDKSALVISGPAQLESYRCLGDFTATEKLEMSLKRNSIVKVLQKHPNGQLESNRDGKYSLSFKVGGLFNSVIKQALFQVLILNHLI